MGKEIISGNEIADKCLKNAFIGGLTGLVLGGAGGFLLGEKFIENYDVLNSSPQLWQYFTYAGSSVLGGSMGSITLGMGAGIKTLFKYVLD